MTMRVARLYSYEDIRIEEAPVPSVGPREALMRTRASGICSGDVMPWYIERKAPLILGHEPAGEIVEVGREVRSFKVGDRVSVHHHAPCFRCKRCRRGDYVQCETWRTSRIMPGGIAEYILIPEINLENDTLALREGVSFEDGALVEPLGCSVKALKRARVKPGDTAVVIGLGIMGMLNILALKRAAAGRVIGVDRVPYRLKKALELGADITIDVTCGSVQEQLRNATEGEMAEIVIVGPGSLEALTDGLGCVAPGGSLVMFTPLKPGSKLTLDPNELYFRDMNLITSYSCGPNDTADAMELIKTGKVRADMVVTHRFPIERTAEAYRLTAEARDSLKCMIVFDGEST